MVYNKFIILQNGKSRIFSVPQLETQIIVALATSKSKESFAKNLQNILKLLQNVKGSSKKKSLPSRPVILTHNPWVSPKPL